MFDKDFLYAILIISIQLLVFVGIRKGILAAWQATLCMSIGTVIVCTIFVLTRGDGMIGALCLSTLMALAFGIPTFFLGRILEKGSRFKK